MEIFLKNLPFYVTELKYMWRNKAVVSAAEMLDQSQCIWNDSLNEWRYRSFQSADIFDYSA